MDIDQKQVRKLQYLHNLALIDAAGELLIKPNKYYASESDSWVAAPKIIFDSQEVRRSTHGKA